MGQELRPKKQLIWVRLCEHHFWRPRLAKMPMKCILLPRPGSQRKFGLCGDAPQPGKQVQVGCFGLGSQWEDRGESAVSKRKTLCWRDSLHVRRKMPLDFFRRALALVHRTITCQDDGCAEPKR